MCSFASRDRVNISSTIQHNSKANYCVCVFEKDGGGWGWGGLYDRREREREREREAEEETKGGMEVRGKREEFALSYVSHCCGCTFTVGLIKGSSLFDAWSVVCFIGRDCLCVKVCRLTTVVVLVIVNDQVYKVSERSNPSSLSLSLSLSLCLKYVI